MTHNQHPFAQASAYASQFLHNSFAPLQHHLYRQDGQGQSHQASSGAPLFYSTLDNGSVAVLDEEHGMLLPASSLREQDKYQRSYYRPPSHRGRGVIDEEEDEDEEEELQQQQSDVDAEDHNGLGRYGEDERASTSSTDPFKPAPSRPVTPSLRSHADRTTGWRAYNYHNPLRVSQAALNNIYDHAESVYSSVFIGGNHPRQAIDHQASPPSRTEKGKGRGVLDGSDASRANVLSVEDREHDASHPPAELLLGPLHPVQASPQTEMPTHSLPSTRAASDNYGSSSAPDTRSLLRFYPMPLSRYRSSRDAPDTGWQDQRYRDSGWTAAFLANATLAALLLVYTLFFTSSDISLPSGSKSETVLAAPYGLLHAVPLLFAVTVVSGMVAGCMLALLVLLQSLESTRLVLHAILVAPPLFTAIGAMWAFSASYSHFSSTGQTVDTSTSVHILRWTSLFVAVSVLLNARWYFRTSKLRLERTLRVLQVAVEALLAHPSLFTYALLTMASLLTTSVPFAIGAARLLLSSGHLSIYVSGLAWVPSRLAIALLLYTSAVYVWTIGVLQALLQHLVAGTVSHWWFHRQESQASWATSDEATGPETRGRLPASSARAVETVSSALDRTTTLSFGTVAAAGLFTSFFKTVEKLASLCAMIVARSRRINQAGLVGLLIRMALNLVILPLLAATSSLAGTMSSLALTHAAITGESYWHSSREVRDLVSVRQRTDVIASREFGASPI